MIVEGTVVGKGKIDARMITVKCPSRYQDGTMQEEEMPDRYKQSPLTVRKTAERQVETEGRYEQGAGNAAQPVPPRESNTNPGAEGTPSGEAG